MNQLFANPVAAMMQGHAAAQGVNDIRRNNALNRLYQEQGAGIASGDPQALNALAQLDPMAALDVRRVNAQERRADRGLQIDEERLGMAKQQARLAAEQLVQAGRAAEVQAEAEETRRIVEDMGTALGRGDMQTFEALKMALGDDFAAMSPDTFPAFAAMAGASVSGMYDAMDAAQGPSGGDRYKTVGGQLVDLYADGGPAPVAGVDGRGAGTTVYDPATGNPLVSIGGVPSGQNPQTTNTPRDGGKLSQKLSENDAATLMAMSDAATSAAEIASLATQLETVAPNVGYTGFGGGLVGAVDDVIGVLPGDSGARGAFKSLAMEAQLSFTEKTKGAITDREMGMFREAVPNLGQKPAANKAIAQVMRAGAKRVQDRNAFFETWARKHGTLEGAQEVWGEFMQDNPVIVDDGAGGVKAAPGGDWKGYVNRMPAAAYTPQIIMGLSKEELAQVPVERMTEAQLDALEIRMQQVEK